MRAGTVVRAATLAVLGCVPAALGRESPPSRFEPLDVRLLVGERDRGGFFPRALAVGPDGCPVVAGQAWARSLPLRRPLQVLWGPGIGPYVMKLDPTGSRILFATCLGGTTAADEVVDCAVGPDGDIYVIGRANSLEFPTTPHALQGKRQGIGPQGFLCRIDPDEGRFVYSTLLGDHWGTHDVLKSLAVGPDGSAYVTGRTGTHRIGLAPEPAPHDAGGPDSVVAYAARVSPDGSSLLWTKPLDRPGAHTDPSSIAVTRDGDAVVTGRTCSQEFPRLRSSIEPWAKRYFADGFLVRLDSEGRLLHSGLLGFTRWGGTGDAVAVDAEGTAWTAGYGNWVPPPEYRDGRVAAPDDHAFPWIRLQGWNRTGDEVGRAELQSDGGTVWAGRVESVAGTTWVRGRTAAPDLPVEQPALKSDLGGLDFLAQVRTGKVVDSFALGVSLGGDPLLAVAPDGDVFVAGGLAGSVYPERPNAAVLVRVSSRDGAAKKVPPAAGDADDAFVLRRLPGWRPGRWWEKARAPVVASVEPPTPRPRRPGDPAGAEEGTSAPAGSGEGDAPEGTQAADPTLEARKGRLDDRPGRGRDSFQLRAQVTGAEAARNLEAFDPAREPLRLRLGDALYPFLVEIPAGDPGWKEKGPMLVWETEPGAPFRARVAIRREDGGIDLEVSGFDFPGPQRNPIQAVLEGLSPMGGHAATWTMRGEGRFIYR